MFKHPKIEFDEFKTKIDMAKNDINEEIRLASEQEAGNLRTLMGTETTESQAFRASASAQLQQISICQLQQSKNSKRFEELEIRRMQREKGIYVSR